MNIDDEEFKEIMDYYEGEVDGLVDAIIDHPNLTESLSKRFVIRFKRLYRPENDYEEIISGLQKFLNHLERRSIWNGE